jgi:signal transduction histidine kinase
MLVLSPLGGYWLASRATEPIAQINALAAQLQPSKMGDRLPLRGTGDELDVLSETINSLLDRIASYLDRNRQFVANAAHELRSPLTAIQSTVEVALNADRKIDEYKELLDEIVVECSDLRLLVNQLLLLAEADTEASPTGYEAVNLAKTVAKSIDMFRDAAEEQGVALSAERLDSVQVRGHAGRLRQVVNNLIDNALKFNRPGGSVTLDLRAAPLHNAVSLRISDTGIGISEQDLPHVFDRFYRGHAAAQARGTHRSGNGLGLSICKAIVTAHGGTIEVESTPDKGTTITVMLPAYIEGADAAASQELHSLIATEG